MLYYTALDQYMRQNNVSYSNLIGFSFND